MGESLRELIWLSLVKATPILAAAIGGVISERSGVVNIALEGMMASGAFTAVVASYYTGNPYLAFAIGMLAGAFIGWILGEIATRFKVDQIVAGIGLNILCLGGAAYGLMLLFGQPGASPQVHAFGRGYIALVWIALLGAILVHALIYATPWGLRLRACGENPKALRAANIDPLRMRVLAVTLSGLCAGFAGAFLSVGELNLYSDGMTAGRGFIALAAIIFGRWTPLGAAAAAIVFGVFEALQFILQGRIPWLPTDLMQALPYIAALIALAGVTGRVRPPAADGVPL